MTTIEVVALILKKQQMNILNKILGLFKRDKINKADIDFDSNTKGSAEQHLYSFEDLEKLVIPIIRNATKIEIQSASTPPENSQLISHFGGQPYFEEGAEWYKSKAGKNLDFIFQIFNNDEIQLPKSIKLIQFFYDLDEFPWDTDEDGWFVKIYETLHTDKLIKIDNPTEFEEWKYCEVTFKSIKSLPDWEGIDLYEERAAKLSSVLNSKEDWDSYEKVVEKLIGEQDYQSQLGGYPRWVQGESTPTLSNGENMKLLFQIDSDNNAGLMWGDVGLVYVFYDEETKRTEFTLQCH